MIPAATPPDDDPRFSAEIVFRVQDYRNGRVLFAPVLPWYGLSGAALMGLYLDVLALTSELMRRQMALGCHDLLTKTADESHRLFLEDLLLVLPQSESLRLIEAEGAGAGFDPSRVPEALRRRAEGTAAGPAA